MNIFKKITKKKEKTSSDYIIIKSGKDQVRAYPKKTLLLHHVKHEK